MRPHASQRRWVRLAVLLPVGVALGACGGEEDTSDGAGGDVQPSRDLTAVDAFSALDLSADSPCGTLATAWARCAANPLATAGARQPDGRYELAIGDPDVQYDDSRGLWLAWWSTTLAVHYLDHTNQLGIKYAESDDGLAFRVQQPLAIATSGNPADWDSAKLETPSVLHLPGNPPGTRFILFYSGADAHQRTILGNTIPWYQVGVAISDDGKGFQRLPANLSPYGKPGLVLEGVDAFPGLAGVADGSVADPEVVFDGAQVHLFFSSLAVDKYDAPLAFGISHATSGDGIHFTMAAGNPIAVLVGGKGPSVVRARDGGWEIFYQRDSAADLKAVPSRFNPQLGIWRSTSSDLSQWTAPGAARELTWDGTRAAEKYGWIAVGDMVHALGEYRYYYPAFSALAPPSPDWIVPTESGNLPSLIVLDMARQSE